jgi:hypothetical protein
MGWWFGRKSAPADARPFVPAWLKDVSAEEEGFARSVEGMAMYERSSGTSVVFRNGVWEAGMLRGSSVLIEGQQVVGARAPAIESPSGGAVVDGEARAAVDAILDTLRQHGLIES